MANTHAIWVPKAINQGGLMLSNAMVRCGGETRR